MDRIIGLDLGSKTCGVSICDALHITCRALTTVRFESDDYEIFWELLTGVLESNHEAKPLHTLEEIKELANLFPKNIKLFLAKKDERVAAGALIYENQNIVHTQYLANSGEGREIGALDLLIDYLIKDIYKNKKYFEDIPFIHMDYLTYCIRQVLIQSLIV